MGTENYIYCKSCNAAVLRQDVTRGHLGHDFEDEQQFITRFEHIMTTASDKTMERYADSLARVQKYEADIGRDVQSIEDSLNYIRSFKDDILAMLAQLKQHLVDSYNRYQDEQVEILILSHTRQLRELLSKREQVAAWERLFTKEIEEITSYRSITSSFSAFLTKAPSFPAIRNVPLKAQRSKNFGETQHKGPCEICKKMAGLVKESVHRYDEVFKRVKERLERAEMAMGKCAEMKREIAAIRRKHAGGCRGVQANFKS